MTPAMEGGVRLSGPVPSQLLHGNVQRFRGGLVFKAHRFLYNSTPGLRATEKKRIFLSPAAGDDVYRGTLLTRNNARLGPFSRTMTRAVWQS